MNVRLRLMSCQDSLHVTCAASYSARNTAALYGLDNLKLILKLHFFAPWKLRSRERQP